MANFKKLLKNYKVSDAAKKSLTPEQLARLKAGVERLKTKDYQVAEIQNHDKFDAKGMVPEGQDHPVDWNPKKKQ